MSDCYCDYDPPEFYRMSVRTARKEHRCDECGKRIVAGEKYEVVVGKWDGNLGTFETCEQCRDLRQWTQNNVPCFCWAHGNILEDAKEAVVEAQYRAPTETVGLYFGFLRRLHSIKRPDRHAP